MINTVLISLFVLLLLIYYVSKRKLEYWKKRNVIHEKPVHLLGNYGSLILQQRYMGQVVQSLCQKFPNAPYFGAYYGTVPVLLVQDPEMIKQILVKDFCHFTGREVSKYTDKETVTQNLFFTYGDRWKVLRQNLTPLFSSSKMKNMFYLIKKCTRVFEDMLDYEFNEVSKVQAIRPLMARYTMDCIGSCAFGIDTKTMAKESKNNPFTIMGTLLFLNSRYRGFKVVARSIWPSLFYSIGMKSFPTQVNDFFFKVMTDVFANRDYKPSPRNDFVDLILNLKQENYITGDSLENMTGNAKKVSIEVDDELLVSQGILFWSAGFESSSTTLQYTFYELAKNQDAQNLARKEIDDYLKRHDNTLEYECISELQYTDACIKEALRLYPVLGTITREVTKDYRLPCGAIIEKGVNVHIPVYHLHHNPNFFPDPELYRPERFLSPEINDIQPHTYLPFGEGSRMCIGMRFAKMQILAGIVTVLKKYRVELAVDTPNKLDFTPLTIVTQPKQTINLLFVERPDWRRRLYKE